MRHTLFILGVLILRICFRAYSEKVHLEDLREKAVGLYPSLKEKDIDIFLKYLYAHTQWLESNGTISYKTVRETPVPFNCTVYSPSSSIPTSVHRLRPGDIKLVASLGDSMTAAFGAKASSIWFVFTEYRGISWSIGGDNDIQTDVTMPNILKIFNPKLMGYSVLTGRATSSNSRFNRAVTGSIAADLLQQANELVNMMKNDPNVNMNEDWKVITIWIGGNDLCEICDSEKEYEPEQYQQYVRETLRILKKGIPRLFVNLVLGIDVTQLYDINGGFCDLLHAFECSCATNRDPNVRSMVQEAGKEYNNRLISLRDEEEFNNSDDFTVVIQPFLRDTRIPQLNGKPDLKYLSPDCFHFSQLSHEAAAVALWNNMMEPVSSKLTQWTIGEPIECPSPDQFLYTNMNSRM